MLQADWNSHYYYNTYLSNREAHIPRTPSYYLITNSAYREPTSSHSNRFNTHHRLVTHSSTHMHIIPQHVPCESRSTHLKSSVVLSHHQQCLSCAYIIASNRFNTPSLRNTGLHTCCRPTDTHIIITIRTLWIEKHTSQELRRTISSPTVPIMRLYHRMATDSTRITN